MLLGEHAVVRGGRALVAAVAPRIHVALIPSHEPSIVIASRFGESVLRQPEDLDFKGPHRFVMAAVAQKKLLPRTQGFRLQIDSEFSDSIGWGSSAAVVVATLAVLQHVSGGPLDHAALLRKGLQVIRSVQGVASGADIAASVYGGLIAYRTQPPLRIPLPHQNCPILTVVYSGVKIPTPEVIRRVDALRRRYPKVIVAVFKAIDAAAAAGINAVRQKDWLQLGRILDLQQGCMEALGVSDRVLSQITYNLRENTGILGAKISGAGLGDCVVGIGRALEPILTYRKWEMAIATGGVLVAPHMGREKGL